MNNRSNHTLNITKAAVIAALYVIFTFISSLFGLSGGVIQLRLSEMLTILPAFTPCAIPGLFIGCVLSNLLTGCAPWDVVFGSLATLLGAVGTYYLKQKLFPAKASSGNEPATDRDETAQSPSGAVRGSLVTSRKWLLTLPPILANTIVVPFVLAYVYGAEGTIPFFMLTVGIGELLSCGVLGMLVYPLCAKQLKHLW